MSHVHLTNDQLTEKQHERLRLELLSMLEEQTLFKRHKTDIARDFQKMTEMVDGVELPVFRLGPENRIAAEATLIGHITRYLRDWETGFAEHLRVKVMEKLIQGAKNAHENPAMLKVLADKAMPQVQKQEVKHAGEVIHSARLNNLLDELGDENLSQIPEDGQAGASYLHAGVSEEGHEVSMRGSVSTEKGLAIREISQGDDRPVHVCGEDEGIQGCSLPGAEGVLEDDVDNGGRDDMDNHQ